MRHPVLGPDKIETLLEKVPKLPKLAITKARPVDVALSPSENHVLENFVTHEKNTTPVNPTNKNEIKLKYL